MLSKLIISLLNNKKVVKSSFEEFAWGDTMFAKNTRGLGKYIVRKKYTL